MQIPALFSQEFLYNWKLILKKIEKEIIIL